MSRYVVPHIRKYILSDDQFIKISDIINITVVNAIEIRNINDKLSVKTEIGDVDTYQKNELFKLSQETIKSKIMGFLISGLEIAGKTGNTILIEFHT